MKYLKLFESKSLGEYFNELGDKTGVNVIKPEIDDLFLDTKDNLPDSTITDDLTIHLTYRRKNVRKSSISYHYYDNILRNNSKAFVTQISYIKDFLDKCELATKMNMEYWKQVNVSINNVEDLQTFKQDLQSIKDRSESLGYDFWINTHKARDNERSIDNVLPDLEKFRSHIERGSHVERFTIWMLFECDIDESKLKSDIDFTSQIPANIISDFDAFIAKFRIPSKDKQELINIIKRGDWSERSESE